MKTKNGKRFPSGNVVISCRKSPKYRKQKNVGSWKCDKYGQKAVYLVFLAKIFLFYLCHLQSAQSIVQSGHAKRGISRHMKVICPIQILIMAYEYAPFRFLLWSMGGNMLFLDTNSGVQINVLTCFLWQRRAMSPYLAKLYILTIDEAKSRFSLELLSCTQLRQPSTL